jgi:hypothetical protein
MLDTVIVGDGTRVSAPKSFIRRGSKRMAVSQHGMLR